MTKAKLQFKSVQTSYGVLHTMRTLDENGGTLAEYHLLPARPASAYLSWVGPAYMDSLGRAAWRIGRNVAGGLVAWKTVRISKRFGQDNYRMRSVPGGYKGDYVKCWSRNINGKTFDFSRVYWNAGQDGSQLTVRRLGQDVHQWRSDKPVKMK